MTRVDRDDSFDANISALLKNAGYRQTLDPKKIFSPGIKGRKDDAVWPAWLPFLASAAALIFVLSFWWNSHTVPPPILWRAHSKFAANEITNNRYVGMLGGKGVLEYVEGGSTKQRFVSVGDIVWGYKVIAIEEKRMIFESKTDKSVLTLKLKGDGKAGDNVESGADYQVVPNFKIEGHVYDADGKPVKEANVSLFGKGVGGGIQAIGVKYATTNEDGYYHIETFEKVVSIRVSAPKLFWPKLINGKIVEKPGLWEKNSVVDISIPKDAILKISGLVIGIDGKPFADGAWSVFAYKKNSDSHCALTSNEKRDGEFEILISKAETEEVDFLRLNGPNMQGLLAYGPWKVNSRVEFDLRRAKTHVISGKVVLPHDRKEKSGGLSVWALDKDGRRIGRSIFDEMGNYTMTLCAEACSLEANYSLLKIYREGVWNKDEENVDFDFSKVECFELECHVKDFKGKGVWNANITAIDKELKWMGGASRTGADGVFKMYFDKPIEYLSITTGDSGVWLKKQGPFTKSQKIEVDLSSMKLFELRFQVTDKEGRYKDEEGEDLFSWPQIYAYNANGEKLSSARPYYEDEQKPEDFKGIYALSVLDDEVAYIIAKPRYGDGPTIKIIGPWRKGFDKVIPIVLTPYKFPLGMKRLGS